jgi:segregation and condensation protein B
MEASVEDKKVYENILEALLFSSDTPLSVSRIREIIPLLTPKEIATAIQSLNDSYRSSARTFEIREIAGGYQIFTLPEYADYVERLNQSKQRSRLSQKALETMAIMAYKQPITKHEIEDIRGVNVDGVIKTLLSRNLTTISGRAKAPGSPFLYVTTKKFLEYFGLRSLEDLPKLKEIDELVDVEDERFPHRDTILKEIKLDELGLQTEDKSAAGEENSDGKEPDPA